MENLLNLIKLANQAAAMYAEFQKVGFIATISQNLPATGKFLADFAAFLEGQPLSEIKAELLQVFGDVPATETEITKLFGGK